MTISEKLNTIKESLGDIKTAILNKGQTPSGNITTYADAIDSIQTGDTINNQNKTITENGVVTADTGYTGLGEVTINVDTVNNDDLTITPSTSCQVITPTGNYTGFGEVTVNAVTSSIDNNISAGNIKSGVTILGVSGSLTELNGQTKTVNQNGTVTPDSGYNALTSVTVNVPTPTFSAQNKTITSNGTYTADSGYDGLGEVTVNVSSVAPNLSTLSVTPTTSAQTITASNNNYDGYSEVSVSAVDNTIDSNIQAGNIKSGVTILGVTGTMTGSNSTTLSVDQTTKAFIEGTVSGNVVLANDITRLKEYAFINGTGITSLSGDNVISFGQNCFENCTSLTSVSLPNYEGTSVDNTTGELIYPSNHSNEGIAAFMGVNGLSTFYAPKMQFIPTNFFPSGYVPTNLTIGTIIGVDNNNTQWANRLNLNPFELKYIGMPISAFQNTNFNWSNIDTYAVGGVLTFNNLLNAGAMFNMTDIAATSTIDTINFPSLKRVNDTIFNYTTVRKDLTANIPITTSNLNKAIIGYVNQSINLRNLTVNFPNLVTGVSEIAMRSSLKEVNLPACTSITRPKAFQYSKIDTINLPLCASMANQAFTNATIGTLNVPSIQAFNNNDFTSANITNLILGGNSVVTVTSTATLGTITNIYVPDSLVSAYEADAFWSRYPSGTIKALSVWTALQS